MSLLEFSLGTTGAIWYLTVIAFAVDQARKLAARITEWTGR